ncbi:MAG TPA: CidA/LrgA family protein [Roseiarcus sp.]|jgi:holin-like protein
MPTALAILVGAQLVGEILSRLFHLPLPGPVVGMFLLAVALVLRGGSRPENAAPGALADTANALVGNMGLLFVPAGVGIISEVGVLRSEWLPILAGMVVSTALSLVVTGLVMQHVSRRAEKSAPSAPLPASAQEALR